MKKGEHYSDQQIHWKYLLDLYIKLDAVRVKLS